MNPVDGLAIKVASVQKFCPHCQRRTWFHKRHKDRWVCRGSVPLKEWREGARDNAGCSREF